MREHYELYYHVVEDGHICKTDSGFGFAQLRFLVEGSCTLRGKEERSYGKSTLIYIPPETPYELCWSGENGAAYYDFEFAPDPLEIGTGGVTAVSCDDLSGHFAALEKALGGPSRLSGLASGYALLAECERRLGDASRQTAGGVDDAIAYINEHCTEDIRVEDLARLCHLSASRFYGVFKQQTGLSPIRYKNAARVRRAAFLLRDGYTEEAICERLGFCSTAFFRRIFKATTGATPSEYLREK